MKSIPGSTFDRVAADESAAEFLRAQEVKVPASVEELQQAGEASNAEAEKLLGQFERWHGMKEMVEDDQNGQGGLDGHPREGGDPESPAYEAWIDAILDLDEVFIDEHHGVLGKKLMELSNLDEESFIARKDEVRLLLQQTGNIALRLHPSIHRLVTLGFASDRFDAVEKLSIGNLNKQEKVNGVSITPRRRTIIGLLRDLDNRLPAEEQTNVWSLEVAPELPTSLVVTDPFSSNDDQLAVYWKNRIAAHREVETEEEATILSLSGEKTTTVIYELENIVEHADDEVLKNAAKTVAEWLDGKRIYYQDPDPRDFELYHLGMEDPAVLMDILRSLDVIKHFDPELFFELLGINAAAGGRSAYFGSFLHKAMYNTERTIEAATPELGTMAIATMMKQLLTVDDHVQTYAAVVSQESLKVMAGKVKQSIDEVTTPTSKAQMLMMMAVPYSRMAIDAEVRRQLEALREASSENVAEELHRRIADIEYPLKLEEYLVHLPAPALQDIRVVRELRMLFTDEEIQSGLLRKVDSGYWVKPPNEKVPYEVPVIRRRLYDRIPLIDESRPDLGFALRIKVALRDAVAMADQVEEFRAGKNSEKTKARQFLKTVMPTHLYREDFEAIKDEMRFWERPIAERFSYASRSAEGGFDDVVWPKQLEFVGTSNDEDRAFLIGQMLVSLENSAQEEKNVPRSKIFLRAKDCRPDLVFLSVIAHPLGKRVAFEYFDQFCDIISAERMCEILNNSSAPILLAVSEKLGRAEIEEPAMVYVRYLRQRINGGTVRRDPQGWTVYGATPGDIPDLIKLNRVLFEGKTPWEIQTGYRSNPPVDLKLDLFEIYQAFLNEIHDDSYHPDGGYFKFRRDSIRNPDVNPPDEEMLRQMRACYSPPETSYGSDEFDTRRFIELVCEYFSLPNSTESKEVSNEVKIIRSKIRR